MLQSATRLMSCAGYRQDKQLSASGVASARLRVPGALHLCVLFCTKAYLHFSQAAYTSKRN